MTRKNKKNQERYVTVVYEGYDQSLDRRLEAVAEKYNGEESGAGFGFGERDIGYIFPTLSDAFKFMRHLRTWKSIKSCDLQEMEDEEEADSPRGKSFCVTGTMFRPRKEIHRLIESVGGVVHASVKSGTDYLVVGDKVGATKIQKALDLGTSILRENEFFDMVEG